MRRTGGDFVDDEKPASDWNSNPCAQKSRAITKLELRVYRVRIPLSPPSSFARERSNASYGEMASQTT